MSSPLERAVDVMNTLRSPGGCAWDAEQTHESLTRYLLEESYEVLEAIETGDVALLREELGDLLLQVLFHARIAQELPPREAFGIDEVAADLVGKLVRRHPHVFAADGPVHETAEQLNETWERQKIVEKGRTSAVDGVPIHQPALMLSAKLVSRARRAQLGPDIADVASVAADNGAMDRIGGQLFALVQEAVEAGVDPEAALRQTARRYRDAIRAAESAAEQQCPGR